MNNTTINFVSIDRVLAKLNREIEDLDIDESHLIEWIGEALDFMRVPAMTEEAVAFLKVKDYQADLPSNLHLIRQVRKIKEKEPCKKSEVVKEEPVILPDCGCEKPIKIEFNEWTLTPIYKEYTGPIRLASHTFVGSLVCKDAELYNPADGRDEYTIVGTYKKKLRFSFRNGTVALAYLRSVTDETTGYPMILDQISVITAVTYYLKWKIAERGSWKNPREYGHLAQDSERHWLKYCGQAKAYMSMPKTLDELQDLKDMSTRLIPKNDRYYGFFGNLTKPEHNKV